MNAYNKLMILNGIKISTMAFMSILVASTCGGQPMLFAFIITIIIIYYLLCSLHLFFQERS